MQEQEKSEDVHFVAHNSLKEKVFVGPHRNFVDRDKGDSIHLKNICPFCYVTNNLYKGKPFKVIHLYSGGRSARDMSLLLRSKSGVTRC